MAGLFDDPESMNKLMQSPLVQMGLGILSNNKGQFAMQNALGGGAQGLLQSQEMSQRNDFNAIRKQQLDLQAQQNELQNKRINQQIAAFDAEQSSLANMAKTNPEYADLLRLNLAAAIRVMNPAAGGVDPYFTPIATENGLGSYNNRTGKFEPLNIQGRPIVKSTDSPLVRGAVKGAEAQATANWKPNDMIDGVIATDAQIANSARGSFPSISPNVQSARDNKRLQILLNEQASYGGAGKNPELDKEILSMNRNGFGISVPTKAQEAADIEKAKSDVSSSVEKVKNVKKADQFLSVANQAKEILNNSNPTSSGVGAVVDSVAGAVGYAPKGASEASRLDALSGWLVANVPRMEGPQSNFDVQNYQTMAGMIGDRTKPLKVRQDALNEVIKLQEKYKSLNANNIMPRNEPMPKAARKYNPKTGRIE
jgi:hypothetical protein